MLLGMRLCREASVTDTGAVITLPIADAVTSPAAGTTPVADAGKPAATSFAIPETYKDKPYLKGVDSMDKVYAMLDGAQTLIGKRPSGIPAPDAPQEEWDKFYNAAGRPETADKYELEGADKADPEFTSELKKIMHKYGMTATQAKGFYKDAAATINGIAEKKGIAAQQADTDFEALAKNTFGANKDAILATSKALLDKHTPAAMKGELSKLSNENLIVMAGVLDSISKQYIKADGAPLGAPVNTGLTPAELQAKGRELMSKPEYSNPRLPGHKEIVEQVKGIYAQFNKK